MKAVCGLCLLLFACVAQVIAVVWKWPHVTLANCLTFWSLRLSICKGILCCLSLISMECFESWLDSVHKASWPPQERIQCMILFLVSELLGQALQYNSGHYLCFWTAWRGNSHHSGQNNPLQFLNGGDCLSMEHKFNRWLPTFHLILWLSKLCSLKLQLADSFVETWKVVWITVCDETDTAHRRPECHLSRILRSSG